MRLVLGRWLNKRFVELRPDSKGETVGILTRSGEYRYVRWLGFVHREQAKLLGRPVKLQISRIGRTGDSAATWENVPPDRHVQGCLTEAGAYAVVEDSVRIV